MCYSKNKKIISKRIITDLSKKKKCWDKALNIKGNKTSQVRGEIEKEGQGRKTHGARFW